MSKRYAKELEFDHGTTMKEAYNKSIKEINNGEKRVVFKFNEVYILVSKNTTYEDCVFLYNVNNNQFVGGIYK